MFDIHMHVTPDVDDGSMNFDMSMEMLQMAYLQGVRRVIATPHVPPATGRAGWRSIHPRPL